MSKPEANQPEIDDLDFDEDTIYWVNQPNWNERAQIHMRDATGYYDIAGFKAGGDSLLPIEAREIGDVRGLRVAHLQCHFGLDTLSLARRGAKVFGLDFSSVAIAGARNLAAETGIAANFVESDVYEARQALPGMFDLVYATWGTIIWLPNIARWGKVVGSLLKPGGRLYLLEIHPLVFSLQEDNGRHIVGERWKTAPDKPLVQDIPVTYNEDETPLDNTRNHEWLHPISSIIEAVIGGGMQIEYLREHETLPYRAFPSMVELGRQHYRLPDDAIPFPLSFSLSARKT